MRFEGFAGDWGERHLGDVIESGGSGGTPSATNSSYYGGSIPFLGIADIDGRTIHSTAKTLTQLGLVNSSAWVVPAGAVALAMYASVGKVGVLGMETATSQAFYNMVFADDATRDFIYARLLRAELTAEWEPYISTGTQRNLNAGKVKRFPLRVPGAAEQQAIGVFFSHLDATIDAGAKKLEKLRALKKTMLVKMFAEGDARVPEIRFKGFDEEWDVVLLGETFLNGGSGGTPAATNRRYYGGTIPFLGIADIAGRTIKSTAKTLTQEGLAESAAWVVPAGAIALAMYASVGKVGILGLDTATSQAFYNMVFSNEATRDFVYARLLRAELMAEWEPYISTGTQRNLNAEKVKGFPLRLPPLAEQTVIGAYFRELDALIDAESQKLEKLRRLKSSFLRLMFA